MIEILTSDASILLFAGLGLIATAVSIVRDTRAQRARPNLEELSDQLKPREKLAA